MNNLNSLIINLNWLCECCEKERAFKLFWGF